ncbi:sigma-54-dependent transcriptional regulator [Limibacillus halophilus]
MANILIVEDNEPLSRSYLEFIKPLGYGVTACASGEAAWQSMQEAPPSVVLLDLHLPDMIGLDLIARAREEGLPCSFVVVTSDGSVDQAVEAIRAGAEDFIVKPATPDRLRITLANAVKRHSLEAEVRSFRDESARESLGRMRGGSLAMQTVYRIVTAAARSKATVFITGQSGTGKELCAEAIHSLSPRAEKPFIALNCAAIPAELIESEIFGHVKGAFTGAAAERIGAAGRADGGTLFLDEICEMNIDLQSKLLRFIQTETYQKVGASKQERADIRFVCATNRDPLEEVRQGRFREDLYYRLHVIPVEMPALAERDGDIILLAETFLKRFSKEEGKDFEGLSPEAEELLIAYPWPGNVRELENAMQQVAVLHEGPAVTPDMLPPPLRSVQAASGAPAPAASSAAAASPDLSAADIKPLWQVEREAIEAAIAQCGGSIPRAARLLDVSPSTIYRKKESWEEG